MPDLSWLGWAVLAVLLVRMAWVQRTRSIARVLAGTRRIKVHGIFFTIRKLNPLDFLTGANVAQRLYDNYQAKLDEKQPGRQVDLITAGNIAKLKAHYTEVFLAGVVDPPLKRKQEEPGGLWVEGLFNDWTLATELFQAINVHTYGKKKLRSLASLARARSSSISSPDATESDPRTSPVAS